jgi:hypothetical protein
MRPGQKVSLHRVTFVNQEPCTIPNAAQIWLIWCEGTVLCFQQRKPDLGSEKFEDNRENIPAAM